MRDQDETSRALEFIIVLKVSMSSGGTLAQRCDFEQVMIRFQPDYLPEDAGILRRAATRESRRAHFLLLQPLVKPSCRGSLCGRMLAWLPSILVATDVDRPMKSPLLLEKLSWLG